MIYYTDRMPNIQINMILMAKRNRHPRMGGDLYCYFTNDLHEDASVPFSAVDGGSGA